MDKRGAIVVIRKAQATGIIQYKAASAGLSRLAA
jgi:hypothetical protein